MDNKHFTIETARHNTIVLIHFGTYYFDSFHKIIKRIKNVKYWIRIFFEHLFGSHFLEKVGWFLII